MRSRCEICVHGGEHDRTLCPVSAELDWNYDDCPGIRLRDADTGAPVPCQISETGGRVVLTWLVDGLKAGQTQTLKAEVVDQAPETPGVTFEDDPAGSKVDVRIFGEPFTSYHFGTQWARPFLHPMIGPGGVRVTRDWPVVDGSADEHTDHVHHKSIWVAYGECGDVDNWSEEEGHGWQRHRAFVAQVSGPVFGELVAQNDWCTHEEKKQFEELRTLRFYALPEGLRLFDLTVTFRMTEGPVVFHDTKEGGLVSVRVASAMDVRNGGRIANGYGGANEAETWGKPAPWCDYSGQVDGHSVGIAILDHETNPRYPTQWHVRDYGLMTANCFGWQHYRPDANVNGDMVFEEGQETTWRYRLYVHRGDAIGGQVRDRFLDFVFPPKITLP